MKSNKFLKTNSMFVITIFLFLLFPLNKVYAAASGVPGVPKLSHNQYGNDYDGDFDITFNMWYGNNGTSYKLYEKVGTSGEYKVTSQGTLQDNTPNPQNGKIEIRNRTIPGEYYYYLELINNYGKTSSSEISVNVGKPADSKILIDGIDKNGQVLQTTVKQGAYTYRLINVNVGNPKYKVLSNNTSSVKASIVDKNYLKIETVNSGRAGLKIVEETTGDTRYVGVRVCKADGSAPGMPDYLSIGSVSEDTDNDLNFWRDISSDYKNKRTDIRYIYINGGPVGGWRSWTTEDGDRAKKFIKESLKSGMIPFFVYYNIPDNGEDYAIDIKHIQSKEYMEGYFKDLKFLLDICKEYGGDETVGLIFEPDFLGYMMQQSGKKPSDITANVDSIYSSGILDKSKDPAFEDNVKGLVNAINYTVKKYYPSAYYGWQFNIWAYGGDVPAQGILHQTEFLGWEKGRESIKDVAKQTAEFYKDAGITNYGANFISIDKYGLDGAYESGAPENPKGSKWFWNADIWNNYLLYVKTLNEVCNLPAVLWQIPVGHINSSMEISPYTNSKFQDLTNKVANYEDSAPTYFLGDTFNAVSNDRLKYFSTNLANDPKIKVSGNEVSWGSHMEEAKASGITSILFGAGVNASTDAVGSPPTDNYWWITRVQKYYDNPVKLN